MSTNKNTQGNDDSFQGKGVVAVTPEATIQKSVDNPYGDNPKSRDSSVLDLDLLEDQLSSPDGNIDSQNSIGQKSSMKLVDQVKPEKRAKIVPKTDQTDPAEPGYFTKSIIILKSKMLKGGQEQEKEEQAEAGKVNGRKEILKFCKNTGEKMLSYEESKLEEFETEMEHPQTRKKGGMFLKGFVYLMIFLTVIVSAFEQLGTEKIQVVSTRMKNEFQYEMSKNPLRELLPVHWFLEINKEEVVDRMECLIGEIDDQCQLFDEKKCSIYDKLEEIYEDCMLRVQRKYSKDMTAFCVSHYQVSDLYDSDKKVTLDFYERYHGCLQQSGTKKGKKYCDDIVSTDATSVLTDYYECYERLGVDITLYGEQKCLSENQITVAATETEAATSTTDTEKYQTCLGDLGFTQQVELYKCDIKNSTYDQYEYREKCWPKGCVNDDSVGDTVGDTCSDWYTDSRTSSCGSYDTVDFTANTMCCSCGGGNNEGGLYIGSGSNSSRRLAPTALENTNSSLQTECDDWKALVQERQTCYTAAEQVTNSGFCDTKVLTSVNNPTAQEFFQCYNSIQIIKNDITDQLLCDNLFPLDNMEIGGSFKLMSCYETFGIEFTIDDIHKKCTDVFQSNMRESVEKYHKCIQDLGGKMTADNCQVDPLIKTMRIDKNDIILANPLKYTECVTDAKVPFDASLCIQLKDSNKARYLMSTIDQETYVKNMNYENYSSQEKYYFNWTKEESAAKFRECLDLYSENMPISPIDECKMKFEPITESNYQAKLIQGNNYESDGFYNVTTGYVPSSNMYKIKSQTVEECKEICNNDVNCHAFEFYADHGAGYIDLTYEIGDCQPQSTTNNYETCLDPQNCTTSQTNVGLNLDLYIKNAVYYCETNYYAGQCKEYSDDDCQQLFVDAELLYANGLLEMGQNADDYMVQNYKDFCRPFEKDYAQMDKCISEIDYGLFNSDLNVKLEDHLRDGQVSDDQKIAATELEMQTGNELVYKSFNNDTNSQYCDIMFAGESESESKAICYDQIQKPFGPEKCFMLSRVVDTSLYHYSYFYKYLCLNMEFVELDQVARECLDVDQLDDFLIKDRDDCLKLYEQEDDNLPELSLEGKMWFYSKPLVIEDDEEDLTRIYDKETDIKLAQIEEYICNEAINGTFISSPYQERQDAKTKPVNQIEFKLKCRVHEYVNITRDNLRVHFYFDDSQALSNDQDRSYYTQEDFYLDKLILNRTDSNQQYFDLSFAEDFNLITIQSNKLYHHKSNNTSEQEEIETEDSMVTFTSDSKTTKLFETYSQLVSRSLMPNQNLMTAQTNTSKIDQNVTQRILGIPYKLADVITVEVAISKLNNKIKAVDYDNLVKEEIQRINSFRVNLQMDFIETVVKVHYFTILDIFSQLGGLIASVNSLIGALTFFFLLSFFYYLSSMIHRKYVNMIDLQNIKQYQELVKAEILDEVKAKIDSKQYLGSARTVNNISLVNDSQAQLLVLEIDLRNCEESLDQKHKGTYVETKERLALLEEIIAKYRPQALVDIFEYNAGTQDEWEAIEHKENLTKRNIYRERAKLPLSEIVKQIQTRMTFFKLYELIDNITNNKVKIKKIKDLVNLEKKELDSLKEIVASKDEKMMLQDKQMSEQNERIKTLEQQVHDISIMLKK